MKVRFSEQARRIAESALHGLLKPEEGLEMISFAGELPPEELLPDEAIRDAAERGFRKGGPVWSGGTEGYMPLRERLCERMAASGTAASPDQMLITSSTEQAVDLAVRVLTEPGDTVLVENPTSSAGLRLFHLNGLRIVPVEGDSAGMNIDEAERLIRLHRPKLVYVVPTFANPTGNVWSKERRQGLLDICRNYGVAIIEDDPYGEIKFETEANISSLLALQGIVEGGCVIYMSTLSKTVAPALGTGWTVGDAETIRMMANARQASDSSAGGLDQLLLDQLLGAFPLDEHIRRISGEYCRRMKELQALLRKHAGEELSWTEPRGGMFLWLKLPDALEAKALLRCAARKGTAFDPGTSFYAAQPDHSTARFNFTQTHGERMEQGIARFAEALQEFTARR